MGNIQCEFDERAPSGLWKAYEKEDGTLLTGSYYPRPSTKPLDCDLTKSGFIRLRFRVKGVPAGEDKPVNLKVPWDYIGHGQNRDAMLGWPASVIQPSEISNLRVSLGAIAS